MIHLKNMDIGTFTDTSGRQDDDELEDIAGEQYDDYEHEELVFQGDSIKDTFNEQQNINFIDGKQTLNILTLDEKTRLIGVRAEQLATGAIPLVKLSSVTKNKYSPNICFDIAEEELRQGVLPLMIGRPLRTTKDGQVMEYWSVDQLIDIN